MAYDPDRHHRRSIRLRGYDYTRPGAYFVTICTYDRAHLFGDIVHGVMRLNGFGRIVVDEWHRTAEVRPNVVLDAFVAMPNHVHGIIGIVADVPCGHRADVPCGHRADVPCGVPRRDGVR